jgi:hypothetical protein
MESLSTFRYTPWHAHPLANLGIRRAIVIYAWRRAARAERERPEREAAEREGEPSNWWERGQFPARRRTREEGPRTSRLRIAPRLFGWHMGMKAQN